MGKMYTKQGHEKGSYEAYQWVLDNTQPINRRWEKNPFTLFFKGHALMNACQDAMDPYTFAKDMMNCETYKNFEKDRIEYAPIWYQGEYLRERIVYYQAVRDNERNRMIDALKEKEERARLEEPMRARQIEWENKRWQDYSQEQINEMNNFLPDNVFPNYSKQVTMPVVYRFITANGYHVYVFEKLNGYYMGFLCNPYAPEFDGIRPLKYSYSTFCEDAAELVAKHAPSFPKVKVPVQDNIDHVRRAMGMDENSIPDDLKQDRLF